MTSTFLPGTPASGAGSAILRSIDLRGPAGRLEALLNEGDPGAPFAALVCHPHPVGGGTMHNKVVYHAMKALNAPEWGLGLPVLRFNFRGTGLSEGTHDGRAETGDVTAALDWLENAFKLPVVLVGFSFGAAMALFACCDPQSGKKPRAEVRALAALGLPTRAEGHHYRYSFLSSCTLPKLFLSGDRDQFAPAEDLHDVAETAAEPKRIVLLPGADHFFAGQLQAMQNTLAGWLKEQLP
ncbi:MAG: alpha/beta hydrolase [Acidobacteriota bacterium]|nr:alpha/beta hydrolase [Acidobacteriota bacterium]